MDKYTADQQLYIINGREYSCPFELTTSVIVSKWKMKIVKLLCDNPKLRYNELKKSIRGAITHKMLTQSLRELESDGIVKRFVYSEVPPKVEYALTEEGLGLQHVIEAMNIFGSQFSNKPTSNKRKPTANTQASI